MALQPIVFSDEIIPSFYSMIGLDSEGNLILNEDGVWEYDPANDEKFIEAFAQSYDTYAKDGVINDLDNNGGDYSVIESALKSISSISGNGAAVLGAALAQYWSTVAVDSGTAVHGGNAVTGIVNDALSKQSAFIAAITGSYTTDVKTPPFKEFIENVEVVVKTIIWTITESGEGGGNFPETIS